MFRICRRTQSGVQHRAMLGRIDLFAGEHLVAPTIYIGLSRQREKQPHRFLSDQVLGIIQQQIVETALKIVRSVSDLRRTDAALKADCLQCDAQASSCHAVDCVNADILSPYTVNLPVATRYLPAAAG